MDPVVAAFGTALVGAMATDAWEQVHEAASSLWHRLRPRRERIRIEAELNGLREQMLLARQDGDAGAEKALEGFWQMRLQELLRADLTTAAELQHVLDQVLIPALTSARQERAGTVTLTGSSYDSSNFTQIGTQVNYPGP